MLRFLLDRIESWFQGENRPRRLYPVFEVIDTFFYTPGETAGGSCHVRDAIDFKRMMSMVLIALLPCVLMAIYNTGLQANLAMESLGVSQFPGWRGQLLHLAGLSCNSDSFAANFAHGLVYFLPIYAVCMIVGLGWEILFAVVRGHLVNEGFFVTGLILPLTLPATVPLWQVALATTFGVVVAKEVFGGTGKNFVNPALAGRAFLFFAYPAQISGDTVWTPVDGLSSATPLSAAASGGIEAVRAAGVSWTEAFVGTIPGSMGETSVLACLIGAAVLLVSGVASWRIMLSMLLGAGALSAAFTLSAPAPDSPASLPFQWHLVLGGFAFGLVFMATDPVTAAMTRTGQLLYGFLIGVMVIVVRVANPAFPEGTMLAILFGNVCAPLLDHFVVRAHVKRRVLRYGK